MLLADAPKASVDAQLAEALRGLPLELYVRSGQPWRLADLEAACAAEAACVVLLEPPAPAAGGSGGGKQGAGCGGGGSAGGGGGSSAPSAALVGDGPRTPGPAVAAATPAPSSTAAAATPAAAAAAVGEAERQQQALKAAALMALVAVIEPSRGGDGAVAAAAAAAPEDRHGARLWRAGVSRALERSASSSARRASLGGVAAAALRAARAGAAAARPLPRVVVQVASAGGGDYARLVRRLAGAGAGSSGGGGGARARLDVAIAESGLSRAGLLDRLVAQTALAPGFASVCREALRQGPASAALRYAAVGPELDGATFGDAWRRARDGAGAWLIGVDAGAGGDGGGGGGGERRLVLNPPASMRLREGDELVALARGGESGSRWGLVREGLLECRGLCCCDRLRRLVSCSPSSLALFFTQQSTSCRPRARRAGGSRPSAPRSAARPRRRSSAPSAARQP